MDKLILESIANLFDIKGRVAMRKASYSHTLWVEISPLNFKTAEFLKNKIGYGYSLSYKSGKSFRYSCAADQAIEFLKQIKPFVNWHKNQIIIAEKYQKLKKQREIPGNASFKSFQKGEELKERLDKYNQKTFQLQKDLFKRN